MQSIYSSSSGRLGEGHRRVAHPTGKIGTSTHTQENLTKEVERKRDLKGLPYTPSVLYELHVYFEGYCNVTKSSIKFD